MQQYKLTLKEVRGGHVEKIDEVRGTLAECTSRLLAKYGGGPATILDMPAEDFLRLHFGGGHGRSR